MQIYRSYLRDDTLRRQPLGARAPSPALNAKREQFLLMKQLVSESDF